jgi:2-dehydro-3-deoxy-D-arabinonate dehydratase
VEQAIADLAAHVDGAPTWAAAAFTNAPAAELPHWLPPVDQQDVWAAGVTYARSRVARQQEAVDGGDVYARVYGAERPELFFKARAPWVVGSGDRVGIRRDAVWNVPEPEIALLLNPVAEVVGFTAGNDMSSRDIEGENPLYLPQAKIYERACALGPRLLLMPLRDRWPALTIHLHIERDGVVVFEGETQSANLRRTPAELVDYLCRALPDHDGLVLLTGTGIVPPESFTLAADDLVTIEMDGVGTLQNRVVLVGRGG